MGLGSVTWLVALAVVCWAALAGGPDLKNLSFMILGGALTQLLRVVIQLNQASK
jgi:hypothetical protein